MKILKNKPVTAIFAGAVAMLMMSPAISYADSDDRPGYGMRMGGGWGWNHGRGAEMRFQAIDQNGDGVINDDEAAANAEAVFAAMDADDNGDLTETEFMAARMGQQRGRNKVRQEARQKRKRARFPEMDADKSKNVSQSEFMAAAKKRFAAADEDKDGSVTPWEFRSKRRIF